MKILIIISSGGGANYKKIYIINGSGKLESITVYMHPNDSTTLYTDSTLGTEYNGTAYSYEKFVDLWNEPEGAYQGYIFNRNPYTFKDSLDKDVTTYWLSKAGCYMQYNINNGKESEKTGWGFLYDEENNSFITDIQDRSCLAYADSPIFVGTIPNTGTISSINNSRRLADHDGSLRYYTGLLSSTWDSNTNIQNPALYYQVIYTISAKDSDIL